MNGRQPRTVAEAYLVALKSRGVDWIFGNAGTDFTPVIEAIAALGGDDGLPIPRPVEVIHETVAVAMAHGYYLMTGRPQCVMVHVNVGAANALMGIINACRANVPVLLASGRTPITEEGRLGSRSTPIHWGQEMFDQGGMLREFVKWDNELRAGEQIVALVDRALAIGQAVPRGPVYLSLPREVLAEQLPDGFEFGAKASVAVPSAPFPEPGAIGEAVAMLAKAEHPLIISSAGDKELFDRLGPMAERFAIPVVQFWRTNPTIATDHPMYAGATPGLLLADADVVVVLDTAVPWIPGRTQRRDRAKVIQVGPDPLFAAVPVRSFPADVTITSTAAAAISAIGVGLHEAGYADTPVTSARRAALLPELAKQRARAVALGHDPGGTPMSPTYMSKVISDVIGPDATVVNELGLAPGVMEFTRQDAFFGPPISGGLGWGGGAALGVKLAEPNRLVVWTTGDGSYVFSNPAACHHAAASLDLGLLTIVADNRVWNAVRQATIADYPEGAAVGAGPIPLSSIEPTPDYTKFVEAYGGHGEHVQEPGQLRPALERAIEVTATGRQALVSVHVSAPDSGR